MPSQRVLFVIFVLFFLDSAFIFSQQISVSGKVTNTEGETLAGVNIFIKGTQIGTISDDDGLYTLNYPLTDATIVFSMVGYKRQEIKPSGRTKIDMVLEEGIEFADIFIVGTRSQNRSITETPVPVDVLDMSQLTPSLGQFDVNQVLHYAAPSFNSNRQSGADGSDHTDPASLRGLGPDQTLVLINGKRRHQSSLINIFGSRGRGNTGTDLNAIPVSAIDRIEILRDGASAQYGSDAIAGVINVVLKSSVNVFSGGISTGIHSAKFRTDRDYDGEEMHLFGNYGLPVGESGFINMSFDYLRKGRTNRPLNPDEYAIYRRQLGDAELNNFGTFLNSRFEVNRTSSIYVFGGFNHRQTDAYAWTRYPDEDRNIPAIYPDGFDPEILSAIRDISISGGLQTKVGNWNLDINNTFGNNLFHYFVDGSLNASLLEKSPTRFDAGGFQFSQNTSSIYFSRFFNKVLSGLNVAFGVEYRIDNYQIFAGEESSWQNYGIIDSVVDGRVIKVDVLKRPGGAQGFPGFSPNNEVDEFRTNLGAYVDVELDLTNRIMIGTAVRYEHYSDFGNTVNAKFNTRIKLTDEFAVRASVSSGFRAPSLAQIYFNSIFTDFVTGAFSDKIIARNNSPLTRALGISPLKEETAFNVSGGFTLNLFDVFSATIDGYYVSIKDRIVLTGAFPDDLPEISDDLKTLNVGAAQFFTNAIDTETKGLDIILSYKTEFKQNHLAFSFAGNFNDMELGDIKTTPKLAGKEDIYFGEREKYFLLASAPESKITFAVDYSINKFHSSIRLIRFGKVQLLDFLGDVDIYEPKVITDINLAYDITGDLTLSAGVSNLFDVYPTQQLNTDTESGGLWDAVQMGFSGRFLYTKLLIKL